MKKYFLLVFLISNLWGSAQYINMNINILPPYNSKISTLIDKPGKAFVTIQNTSTYSRELFFKIAITGPNGISIQSLPTYWPNKSFHINPYQLVQVDVNELSTYFDENSFITNGITITDLIKTGYIPEGNYQICITAYDYYNPNTALSSESCSEYYFSYPDPPMLIQPGDNENILASTPQNTVFSWTVPAGASFGTQYLLRIVEMIDPKRNINDALRSASNPVFFEKTVNTTTYIYGPNDPPFVEGRRYVWAVKMLDPNGSQIFNSLSTAFKNNGVSEPSSFLVSKNIMAIQPPEQGGDNNNTHSLDSIPVNNSNSSLGFFDFRGKLMWGFLRTERGLIEQANPPANNNHSPNVAAVNNNNNAVQVNAGALNQAAVGGGGVVSAQQQIRDRIRTLVSDNRHPLTGTQINLYLIADSTQDRNMPSFNIPNGGGMAGNAVQANRNRQNVLLGSAVTDIQGNFDINYFGTILPGFRLKLTVDNPHFYFATDEITVRANENGVYNIGELLGVAKTFRFKPIVKDNIHRNILPEADVTISRANGFYYSDVENENLRYELMRDQLGVNENFGSQLSVNNNAFADAIRNNNNAAPKGNKANNGNNDFVLPDNNTPFDDVDEKCATGKQGDLFGNLFFTTSAQSVYIVKASSPNRYNQDFTFRMNDSGTWAMEGGVPVLIKDFLVALPNPKVTGRLLVGNSQVPITGKDVSIIPENLADIHNLSELNDHVKTAKTKEDGTFIIEDIPVWANFYNVIFNYSGKQYVLSRHIRLERLGQVVELGDVSAEVQSLAVCGTVKDENNRPIANALLTWREGGQAFYTDNRGNFATSQMLGTHTLIVQATGYRTKTIELNISPNNERANNNQSVNIYSASSQMSMDVMTQLVGNVNMANNGNYQLDGNANNNGIFNNEPIHAEIRNRYDNIFGGAEYVSNQSSCGHDIVVKKYAVTLTVGKRDGIMSGARISLAGTNKSGVANNRGIVTISGLDPGHYTMLIKPAANDRDAHFYTTKRVIFDIDQQVDTTDLRRQDLSIGAIVSGRVTSVNNDGVRDAKVYLENIEELETTTDNQGNYVIYGVPLGILNMKAEKSGSLTASVSTRRLNPRDSLGNVNFQLGNIGFSATTLYGYRIILDSAVSVAGRSNVYRITGTIADIPENATFKIDPTIGNSNALHFTSVEVTALNNGRTLKPTSRDSSVRLDESNILLKAYNTLTINYQATNGNLKITAGANNTGNVSARALIDVQRSFPRLANITLPENALAIGSGANNQLSALTSTGNFDASDLRLFNISNRTDIDIYGLDFNPAWQNCRVSEQGILFSGSIAIQQLNNLQLTAAARLNWYGRIDSTSVNMNPTPAFRVGGWNFSLSEASLNEYGFAVSGNVRLTLPHSAESSIRFSNMVLTRNGISGGEFVIPEDGINLFNTVNIKSPRNTTYILERVGNNYKFSGAAKFRVNYIDEDIVLDRFSICTDGTFNAQARVDYDVDFANMASLTISSVGFNTENGRVDIAGGFKLNIPGISAVKARGALHFGNNYFSADRLNISLDLMAGVRVGVAVDFDAAARRFAGMGELGFAGLSGIRADFHYAKLDRGIDVGAGLTYTGNIPIGFINIESIGGSFNLNTRTETFAVSINGHAGISGDPVRPLGGAIGMDITTTLTVSRGNLVLDGSAVLDILSMHAANANFNLDFGNKRFTVDGEVSGGVNIVGDIRLSARADFHLDAKYQGNDTYILFTSGAAIDVLSISRVNADIVLGFNVPRNLVQEHVNNMPACILSGGKFSGFYTNFTNHVHLGGSFGNDYGRVSVSTTADFGTMVYMNLATNNCTLGASLNTGLSASASLEIFGWDAFDVSVSLGGDLSASYSRNNGWAASGTVRGSVEAHIGRNGSCNSIKWCGCCLIAKYPCGAKVCLDASATVSYSSENGFDIDF